MAITQAVCNSFRQELGQATHDLLNDTIKIALYTSAASLDASTTAYAATNEVVATGYTAGGTALTGKTWTLASGVAIFDANDPTWANATITARGALIYNATKANRAILVLDFGMDITSTNDTFRVELPAATNTTAILRI